MVDRERHRMSKMVNSEEDLVTYLTDDVVERMERDKSQDKSNILLYTFIRTGQVTIVRKVLENLKERGLDSVLHWIVRGDIPKHGERELEKGCRVVNVFVYVILSLLSVLTFPIVYICHSVAMSIVRHREKNAGHRLRLPIMHALLSENEAMIRLFLQEGCSIDDCDSEGNNVFHYLAEWSADEPDTALQLHRLLCKILNQDMEIENILMNDRNDFDVTALEATTRCGSVVYLHHILASTDIIGKENLVIGKNNIHLSSQEVQINTACNDDSVEQSTNQRGHHLSARVHSLDYHPFEQGDIFKNQSLILHILTDRNVDNLTADDATVINKSRIFKKWIRMKVYAYKWRCMLMHLMSLLITVAFIVEISFQKGDLNDVPLFAKTLDMLLEVLRNQTIITGHGHPEVIQRLRDSCKEQILHAHVAYRDAAGVIATLCLMLRFLHLIHAMRLLPSIGFFILTTKKMGRILLQFAIVVFLVLLAFATMLHLVLRDKECPAMKDDEFTNIGLSLMTVYKLVLGYGTPDYTTDNLSAQIAFAICTVLILLLMLNLIVAVMTTLATDLNRKPWKSTLCELEYWKEILGVESDVLVVKTIFRFLCGKCPSRCQKFEVARETRKTVAYCEIKVEDN